MARHKARRGDANSGRAFEILLRPPLFSCFMPWTREVIKYHIFRFPRDVGIVQSKEHLLFQDDRKMT
jgi:hypothetical protein